MVSSQSTVDETESSCPQCIGIEIEYLRQIFERTCGPIQQLLQQQLSQMTTTTMRRQPTAAENGVNWKQYLVSALTGKRALVLSTVNGFISAFSVCYQDSSKIATNFSDILESLDKRLASTNVYVLLVIRITMADPGNYFNEILPLRENC